MKRKALTVMTVFILVGAILVGGTLAALNATDNKSNNFVYNEGGAGSPRVQGQIGETFWDNKVTYDVPAGNTNPSVNTGGWQPLNQAPAGATLPGSEAAKNFTTGRIIGKNPQVKSTGTDDSYVAIRLTVDQTASTNPRGRSLEYLTTNIFDFAFNTTNWTEVTPAGRTNERFFVYTGELKTNEITPALFTHMTVKSGFDAHMEDDDKWDLQIHAYIVDSASYADALAGMKANFATDWNF